jgi:hypothetical protein
MPIHNLAELNALPATQPDFNPDTLETIIDEANNQIIFAALHHDQNAQNPCDDGRYTLYSLSHRHVNSISADEALAKLEANPKDVFPLSYYEHSGSLWSLQGSGPRCEFDTVDFAGILVIERDSDETQEFTSEYAQSCLDEFNAWANGDVYGYTVSVYELLRDTDGDIIDDENHYKRKDALHEDSCWNYIGYDYAVETIREAIEGMRA